MEGVELESWRVVELPVQGKATLGYLFSQLEPLYPLL